MNTAIARILNAGTLSLTITPFIDGNAQASTVLDPSKATDLIIPEKDLDKLFWIAGRHAVKNLGPVDQIPETSAADFEGLAQRLWAVYCEAAGGTTFDGKPLPTWETLGEKGQNNWKAVASFVLALVG